MKYIIIFLFCFSKAFCQSTSTGTIQPAKDTIAPSVEFQTQWVKDIRLQVRDIALCYDFFKNRPGVLAIAKQKFKSIGSLTDSSVIIFDSLRIEVIIDFGNFIRSRIAYPDYFNRIDAAIKSNSEVKTYYSTKDDRDIKAAIQSAKNKLSQ